MESILKSPRTDFRKQTAFTLLEILVVVTIVLLMMTLALPAINSVVTGYHISDTGARLAALIERGRTHATVSQQIVGVRFFQGSAPGEFTTVVLVKMVPDSDWSLTTNALSRPFHITESLVLSQSHSSLLTEDSSAGSGTATLSGHTARPYRDFLIFPDGSTSLTNFTPNPYLAVLSRQDFENNVEPLNPLILSIDPVTCRVTTYRK